MRLKLIFLRARRKQDSRRNIEQRLVVPDPRQHLGSSLRTGFASGYAICFLILLPQ